jgi:hypothetical protein
MPTGNGYGESHSLTYTYGYNTVNSFRKALRLPLSGASSDNRGISGVWWTSTNYNTEIYNVSATSSNNNFGYRTTRNNEISVRCILDTSRVQTIANIEYMQDVTSEVIKNTPTNTITTMTDKRDGAKYTVGKLVDGNLWLLDNLALDLNDQALVQSLSSANTNASDTTLNYLRQGGGIPSDRYPITPLNYINWTSGTTYSAPKANTSYINTVNTEDSLSDDAKTWKYGVIYNYCAATAGSYCFGNGGNEGSSSGSAPEDLCPKGWRMPNGSNYSSLRDNVIGYGTVDSYRTALRLPLSGYSTGDIADQGTAGYWWSKDRSANMAAYNMQALSVGVGSINVSAVMRRPYGATIRCIVVP